MFDKNMLLGFIAGAVVGTIGYKYYNQNKAQILEKLKAYNIPFPQDNQCDGTCGSELSIEELEAQKEKLEDLIAQLQQEQSTKE